MIKKLITLTFLIGLLAPLFASPASAATGCNLTKKSDSDGNGIGDAGVEVVCNWESYWSGDGEECVYRNHSRGDFGNDEYLDSGVIRNNIRCVGPDGVTTYTYFIVSSDHPKYTGNPDWALWGTWEYVVLTQSGEGNLVAPPQD